MAAQLSSVLKGVLFNAHELSMDGRGGLVLLSEVSWAIFAALTLPFIVFIIAAMAGNLVQHGFLMQTETMQPKLSKISPIAGLKRLFSLTSLVNFSKSLAKLTIVTVLIVLIMWPSRDSLEVMVALDPAALLPLVQD